MAYSADTSSFIEAWVRVYAPDVFPSVWAGIDQLISDGKLIATDEVLTELGKKQDELFKWAKTKSGLFVPLDHQLQQAGAAILAQFPSLVDLNTGRGAADPFVIALAQVRGFIVVTAERSKPTKPKIPDACGALGVPCIGLLELFRAEGWQI